MLMGSSSADVMHGSWGDDVLEGGAGNDVYIGGAGSDRYVLTDTGSVETLDFKSTRFEKDVLDVSQLLPEGADANNLLSYLSITEEGVFLDVSGNGDFSEENQIARFTEDSVFSRNEILIDIGDNIRVVFNIFAQAGVQLQDDDAFQTAEVLASRTQKYNPRGQDYESDSGPGADASTAFIRSKSGELFNFRLDQHQVEEAHGSDGGEILDAAQVGLSSDAKDDNVADHKLWMYGRDGGDTLQGNADGVMLDGGRGNDRIVAGGGRNMLIGGEGRDEFVLNLETTTGDDLRSDLLYDFTSLEGHRDLIDLQTVLPENVVAENIHAFVKVTDAGVFVDVNGGGQFDASNQLARFGERSDIDNLVRFRLPDGQEIEFDREDALSEQVGTRSGEQLRGGEGGDVLIGLAGNDVLDGDALTNDESADHLYGGRGNDTLIVDGLDLTQGTVEGGDGFDTAKLQGDTGESLSLNLQATGIERAFGGFSDDVLDGSSYTGLDGFNKNSGAYEENSAQRIELFGKYGNDTLKGGIANDYLDGGYDDDVIAGGAGRDFMVGGSGNDTFVLSDDGEIDTLWDFKSTSEQHDVLDLSAFLSSSTSLDDLSSHVHIDNKFVYFDPEGNSQFNYSNAVAKFGGASVVDEPVKISLGDGRVFSKEAGWSSDVVSTQNDGAFIITSESLIANSSLSSASNVSVTNLSSDSGQLTDNGDGTWTLMPNADFNGQLNLDYQVIETTMEADQLLFSTDFANFSSATAGASVLEANTGWQTSNPSGNVELHYETVYGGSDGSNRVIEIEAAVGDNNLYRDISTEAGRSYELNFDFSPRQGVISSGVDVYWGGEKISELDGSSGQFNWLSQTLTLTGDGSEKRLEFRATSNEGAGGLLDNIQLTRMGYEVESDPVETSVMVSADTSWSVEGTHIIADGREDQVLRFTETDLLSNVDDSNGQSEISNVHYDGSDGSLSEVAYIEFDSGTDGQIELDQRLSEYDAFTIEFEYTSTGPHSGNIENILSAQVPSSDNMLNVYIQNHDGSLHLDLGGSGINFDGLNIQDGGTHTVTMTWDSENGAIQVFDNGALIDSSTFKQGLTIPSGGWVMIGQEQDSYGGSLDSTQSVTNARIGHVAMSYDAVSREQIESGASVVEASNELAFDLRAQNGGVVDTTNSFSVSTTGGVDVVHEYFEFTPADNFFGNVTLSYDLSDGSSTVSDSGILSFAPENDGPELQVHESGDGAFTVLEGSSNGTVIGQATASDVDNPDSLVFSLSNDAGGRFTIDPSSGVISVADGTLLDFETSGSHDLTIQVSDGHLTSSQQITIDVSDANEAPTVDEPVDLGAITEVDSITITKAMLLTNTSDENSDALNIIDLSSSNGVVVDNGNDTWTFTPAADFSGVANFGFHVSDGQATIEAQAALRVNQVISEDNFNSGSDGWNQSTSSSDNFNTGNLLGRFGGTGGNEAVFKNFDLPDGVSEVTLQFTLYEIDSWDGEQFQVFVDGQQYHAKSYSHGSIASGSETVIDAQGNTVGQVEHGQGGHVGFYGWVDQAHTYSMTIPVSPDQSFLKIGFGSTLNQALNDESWGIDNLVLSISQYAPESSDNSLIIQGSSIYHFSVADFEFSDSDAGDALQSITITSLPQSGSLMLDGIAVTANQEVAVTDIGNLTFEYGDGSVSPTGFGFTVSDGQHASNEHQFSISQGSQVQSEDLNSYSAGDVNGQNGWSVQKFNTSSSITVNDSAGHEGGKAMVFNSSGPGVGASATLPDSDVGILPDFNVTSSFSLEVDIKKNYWGSVFGIGADGNNDGQITAKGSNSEQGLKFSFGSYNNSAMYITLADGTTVTTSAGGGSGWFRFRWEIDTAENDGQGQGSLMFKSLTDGATEWTTLPELTDLNLGLDPESLDASNPANWDGFFLHFEGAGSGLDGLRVETTSLSGTVDSDIVQGSSEADQLMGSLGDDTLLGDGGGDIIFGGAGDDVMTGGDGSDTFSWQVSDVGNTQNPAEDVITDFHTGLGGDVLDISDLITEEGSAVEELLALNFEDGNTTIDIKSSESGDVAQKITLDGVDLSNYGGGSTDIEIINNLIDDGNLQV